MISDIAVNAGNGLELKAESGYVCATNAAAEPKLS